jgi:hypothetical protein
LREMVEARELPECYYDNPVVQEAGGDDDVIP